MKVLQVILGKTVKELVVRILYLQELTVDFLQPYKVGLRIIDLAERIAIQCMLVMSIGIVREDT